MQNDHCVQARAKAPALSAASSEMFCVLFVMPPPRAAPHITRAVNIAVSAVKWARTTKLDNSVSVEVIYIVPLLNHGG